jgi:hypothetical protein
VFGENLSCRQHRLLVAAFRRLFQSLPL